MVRSGVGCWLLASVLLACGESSRDGGSAEGGAPGTGGSSGSSGTAGESGSAGTGGKGGESGAGGYFEPGSRLKAKVLALDDGVDIIESSSNSSRWYDAELDFDCAFLPDEDGIERCFPLQLLTSDVYADASCTHRVLPAGLLARCDALRSRYVLDGSSDCAYRGFRVGAELPATTPLFSFDGTTCRTSSGTDDIGPLYELEPAPADTFVGMRRVERARAPGLGAHVREGDDGSWEILGYFDAERGAPCFASVLDWSPRSRCIPAYAGGTSWFADSTCERPTADILQQACAIDQPTTILDVQQDTNACPPVLNFGLYEIEGVRELRPYELDDSGACVESARAPAGYYDPGEPVDLGTLPELETLVVGAGRVRASFSGFAGTPYLPIWYGGGPLMDESGAGCVPFGAPDGTVRCVPVPSAVSVRSAFRYEDAACSGAPVVPWIGRPTCPADPPLPRSILMQDLTVECPQGLAFSEAFAVTGKSTATTLYSKDATTGACEPAEQVTPAVTYLVLGQALEPVEFPELVRTIREQ
jgi:hypothetical protein